MHRRSSITPSPLGGAVWVVASARAKPLLRGTRAIIHASLIAEPAAFRQSQWRAPTARTAAAVGRGVTISTP